MTHFNTPGIKIICGPRCCGKTTLYQSYLKPNTARLRTVVFDDYDDRRESHYLSSAVDSMDDDTQIILVLQSFRDIPVLLRIRGDVYSYIFDHYKFICNERYIVQADSRTKIQRCRDAYRWKRWLGNGML